MQRLRTLAAVVDEGGFTRAAEALGISQPGVTQQMAALERETGLALFERAGRRRVPTEAARALAAHGREASAALEQAERVARRLRGLEGGSLRVGASTTPGVYVVPGALGTFAARHPGIEARIEIAGTVEIEERLRVRRVDCAVVGEYEAAPDLAVAPLRPDLLVPVCGPRSPLAGARRVSLGRFLDEPLVAREAGSSTRDVFDRWLAARGRALRPAMELGSTEAVAQVVAAGLGVAVASEASVALMAEAGLLAVPRVAGFPIRRRIDVALLGGRRPSPAAEAFLGILMGARRAAALVASARG